jgi:hypothetical protein
LRKQSFGVRNRSRARIFDKILCAADNNLKVEFSFERILQKQPAAAQPVRTPSAKTTKF